jgi:hypothetical protein
MSLSHFWIAVQWKRSRFDHMQTVIQTSSMLDLFLHEAAQNFELFYQIFKIKNKKIKKPIVIDVLFKAPPNGTTLMQIPSCQTVPLILRFSYFYRKICKPGCGILAADETPLAMEDRFKGTVKTNIK